MKKSASAMYTHQLVPARKTRALEHQRQPLYQRSETQIKKCAPAIQEETDEPIEGKLIEPKPVQRIDHNEVQHHQHQQHARGEEQNAPQRLAIEVRAKNTEEVLEHLEDHPSRCVLRAIDVCVGELRVVLQAATDH